MPTLSRASGLSAAAFLSVLCAPVAAQRMHVAGLIGEPPDTSNWPHPAAPDGNRLDGSFTG